MFIRSLSSHQSESLHHHCFVTFNNTIQTQVSLKVAAALQHISPVLLTVMEQSLQSSTIVSDVTFSLLQLCKLNYPPPPPPSSYDNSSERKKNDPIANNPRFFVVHAHGISLLVKAISQYIQNMSILNDMWKLLFLLCQQKQEWIEAIEQGCVDLMLQFSKRFMESKENQQLEENLDTAKTILTFYQSVTSLG